MLLVLSVPFWWIGAAFLPVSPPMTFVPMVSALALVYRESGAKGAWALVRRALDFGWINWLDEVDDDFAWQSVDEDAAAGMLHIHRRRLA